MFSLLSLFSLRFSLRVSFSGVPITSPPITSISASSSCLIFVMSIILFSMTAVFMLPFVLLIVFAATFLVVVTFLVVLDDFLVEVF